MKTTQLFHVSGHQKEESIYSTLPLRRLFDRIVDVSDLLALEEVHNRPLFSAKGTLLRLIQYINWLRELAASRLSNIRNSDEISEIAYDLAVAKFSELPNEQEEGVKRRGTDCRLYFRAVRMSVDSSYQTSPPAGELAQEARAATILQKYLNRHFRYSLFEGFRRADRFWSMYNWNLSGGAQISLKLPVSLAGGDRKRWLEKNIEDPDPKRPGEAKRIQEIINRKFIREMFMPFEAVGDSLDPEKNDPETKFWSEEDEYHGIMLSKVVAKEKAMNIHRQRPKIKNLGKSKLEKMILQIFDDLPNDDYKDVKIARAFNLSKATFSRFAGSKWSQNNPKIPDLWLNLSQVIANHKIFIEMAEKAGVWEKVKSAANKSSTTNLVVRKSQ
jgi:hypothetical protein